MPPRAVGSGSRVVWYDAVAHRVGLAGPIRAFNAAGALAARAAAERINSTYTGTLARDLSRPRVLGPMHMMIGSRLRYARIESEGGRIFPRNAPYLAIHGRRRGAAGQATRSTFGGDITATVGPGRGRGFVEHKGKHWAEAALVSFRSIFPRLLRQAMFGGV